MSRNDRDAIVTERKLDARLVFSIIAAGIMSFSGVTVETAMNVTFPTLMAEFGINTATVQWMTTSYLLVLAIIIPTSSYIHRRFLTRHIFLFAICFYIAGIVCGYTAQSFPMLILGRVLEGVGTGTALPLMFNIITEQAPQEHMGLMMNIGTVITALAPALGPSVGGWLAENFGWRSIFAVLLPILIVAFFFGIFSIRQSHEVTRDSFDVVGWLLISGAFASLVFAVDMGSWWGWTSPLELCLIAAFIVLLAFFRRREQHVADESPLIHLSIFGDRRFVLGVLSICCLQFIVLGLSFLIPSYAQIVEGIGEAAAGSIPLPGCIVGIVTAPLSGQILDKFGARKPVVWGAIFILLAPTLFAIFSGNYLSPIWASIFFVILNIGERLLVGNAMTISLAVLPPKTKPDGTATISTMQQLSGAMGTSVASAIVNASQVGAADMALATMMGAQHAYTVLALVGLVPLICMSWVTGKHAHA